MKRNFRLSEVRQYNYTYIEGPWPLAVGTRIVYPPEHLWQSLGRSRLWTVVTMDEESDLITLQD